jgi:thymidylate kinase
MKYIVISGIDGSGKTSVITSLQDKLKQEGKRPYYIWMRYNHYFVKIMNALARLLGLSVKVTNEMGTVWEHRYYKSKLFCKVYIICSYLDNLISKYKVKRISSDEYDFVICDRWINDILIDLGAESKSMDFLDSKWYNRFQNILPIGTKQFVIERKKEDILDCRIENQVDPNFPYRYQLYTKLALKKEVFTIDNSGTISSSVEQIFNKL